MSNVESLMLLAGVLVFAFALEFAMIRPRSSGGDSGAFWARMAAIWGGVSIVLYFAAAVCDFSTLVADAVPRRTGFWLGGLWIATGAMGLYRQPVTGQNRWLAGGIGFDNKRHWVAGFAVTLIAPLAYSFGSSDVLDSTRWASSALLAITLLMVAQSPGHATRLATEFQPLTQGGGPIPVRMSDWPGAMALGGVQLDALPAQGAAISGMPEIIPPEILAAVKCLVAAGPMAHETSRLAVLQTPPFHGQLEALTLGISILRERSEEATLLITPGDPGVLAECLKRRLGDGTKVTVVTLKAEEWIEGDVWVVDASMLSQHLLKQFREDSAVVKREDLPLLSRVGLIVWWDVHEYSGVRAANLWAISRRLDRLLKVKGRTGLRTLLFAAAPSDATDRSAAFQNHLFPYEISAASRVTVKPHLSRVVRPYVARQSPDAVATVSVRTGWPTYVFTFEHEKTRSFLSSMEPEIAKSLVPELSQADATVLAIGNSQIAGLADLLAACGRHVHADLPHYVALVLPKNPYVDYLMSVYRERQRIPSQRLLVGAEGHPVLLERHARLALTEYPDTLAGLRGIFRWDDEILTKTIRRLHLNHTLNREAVRFLDEEDRLRRDYLYSNQQPGDIEGSLDTVGTNLVEAKDVDSSRESPAFRVDRDRVVIDAYPRRVFYAGNKRYRVQEATGDFIRCDVEEENVTTIRGRTSRLSKLTRDTDPMITRGVRRYTVSGTYREEITDVVDLLPDGSLREVGLDHPRKTEFATRALVLETGRESDPAALQLIALAMRCMVPIHVGVDEAHLEVLPLLSEKLTNGGFVTGLALVDLMPGGIGVTDAFLEDEALLRFLIDQAFNWLSSYSGRITAEELFRDVPISVATGGVAGLKLDAAVSQLSRMAGRVEGGR